jgi:predicted permease
MYDVLLSFGVIIALGVGFRRLKRGGLDADSLRTAINISVFNIFLPALCIKIIYTSVIDREAFLVPATAWIAILSGLCIALAVYALLEKTLSIGPQEKGVLVLAATFGNVTYLGLPVLTGLYGYDAAKYALYYDLLAATPLLWFVGAPLASRYGTGKKMGMGDSFRTIVSLPPLWGIGTGFLLNLGGVTLPSFLVKTLGMLGDLVVPLMIFTIGLALSLPKVRHAYAIIPAVVIKLGAVPFISFMAAMGLGLEGTALASCFIEGAMPTMVLSLLIASRFKLDESLAAFVIVVTTLLSFVSLPLAIHFTHYLVR